MAARVYDPYYYLYLRGSFVVPRAAISLYLYFTSLILLVYKVIASRAHAAPRPRARRASLRPGSGGSAPAPLADALVSCEHARACSCGLRTRGAAGCWSADTHAICICTRLTYPYVFGAAAAAPRQLVQLLCKLLCYAHDSSAARRAFEDEPFNLLDLATRIELAGKADTRKRAGPWPIRSAPYFPVRTYGCACAVALGPRDRLGLPSPHDRCTQNI